MRKALVIGEQLVASATIFVVNINASRSMSIDDYGVFALFFTAAVLAVGLQRATFAEPLFVLVGEQGAPSRTAIRHVMRGSALVGGVFAFGSFLALLFTRDYVVAVATAVIMVGPFLQDAARVVVLVLIGPGAAICAGMLGLAVQLTASILASRQPSSGYEMFLGAWGSAGIVTAGITSVLILPKLKHLSIGQVSSEHRQQARTFGLDYLLGVVSLQTTLAFAAGLGGPAAAAALRGADSLIGPARVMLQALPQLLLRAWSGARDTNRAWQCLIFALVLAAPIAAVAICLQFIPETWGNMMMGQSWEVISPILPIVVCSLAPITLTQLSTLALKALGQGRALLTARLVSVPITLVCGVGGAILGEAMGAAVGSFVGSIIAAAVFWTALRGVELDKGKKK